MPIENLRFQWSHLSGDSSVGYQYGFQSVFKNLPNVSMVFKLCVLKCFQIMCLKVFSEVLIGFNAFQIMCFKVFSKFPIGFNGFQIVFFQNVFQSVFKLCVSKCFQNSS